MMNRQTERRARFLDAFSRMPKWETWTTKDGKLSATYQMVEGHLKLVDVSATRHHCKIIPRRVRRSMARDLSKREFCAVRENRLTIDRITAGNYPTLENYNPNEQGGFSVPISKAGRQARRRFAAG